MTLPHSYYQLHLPLALASLNRPAGSSVKMRDKCVVQVGGFSVRTATDVVSEVAGAVSVADAIGEVVVSVETGIELAPEVVVVPASVDTVCPLDCPSVWPGGATEPVVESLSGAAITESFPPPELDGGGGGDWPSGRTTTVQSLSSRTDWAPSPPVIGVRVTWHVCVIVPT